MNRLFALIFAAAAATTALPAVTEAQNLRIPEAGGGAGAAGGGGGISGGGGRGGGGGGGGGNAGRGGGGGGGPVMRQGGGRDDGPRIRNRDGRRDFTNDRRGRNLREGPRYRRDRDRPGPNRKWRRWRPGVGYGIVVIPSYSYGAQLGWCHYHRYPAAGMRAHRGVQCHYHRNWRHPSIAYVGAY